MISLASGQTLSAKAGTNNVINCSIFGDLITTVDDFTPHQALIPSSVGTLYTSTGGQSNISSMTMVNTTGVDVTGIQFYIIGTSTTNNPITNAFTIPASGWATYAEGKVTIYDATGNQIYSFNLSNATPAALGVAAAGTSTQASRGDHVHVMPRLDQVSAPTADVSLNSHKLTSVTDPSSAQDAATKNYVDTGLAALNPATAVLVATTANIPGVYVNGAAGVGATFTVTATGAITIDGVAVPANARVLFKDQSSGLQNGVYTQTTIGSLGVAPIFTRATDYNTAAEMNTAGLIPVQQGTLNALSSWQQIATITTVGTDALVFSEFTANPSLYLQKANNLSDLTSAPTARTNLGLGSVATHATSEFQPIDATLTGLSGNDWVANSVPIGTGADTVAQVNFPANTTPARSSTGNLVAKTVTDYVIATMWNIADAAGLTALLNVATTALKGLQSATDKAKQDNNSKFRVNALDFGADPTNASSSATALTNAIAALPNGGVVEFPAGTYNFGNTNFNINTAHIVIRGAARYNTVFTTTATNPATILTRNQYYITVEDVTFTGPGSGQSPTATSGALLACNSANSAYGVVRRVSTTYAYDGIDISDTLSISDETESRFFKHSGIVVNHNSDHQIEQATMDNNTSFLPTGGGIDVSLTASLLVNSCNVIHSNNALNLNAANGVTIPSVKGVNNFFDTSVIGLNIAGAGSVLRCEFTNSWFSSMSTSGISLTPAIGGQVDGITFVNCDIYNNVAGTTKGVTTNAQTKKWKMIGCSVAGWTTGVELIAGTNHYATLECNSIGAISAFGVNTTGISIGSGAYAGIVLVSNDVVNNTTPITIAATPTFADYKQFRIVSNPGINTGGTQTPPAATPVLTTVYQNTFGYPMMVNVKHGATANTSVTINGAANTMGFVAAQVVSYRLEPGDTWAVAGGTAPTVWVWNKQ